MLLNVDMSGKRAVIIGGGRVARRKAEVLLEAGADVRVVAPELSEELTLLAEAGKLSVRYAHYEECDLDGMFLVVAATNNVEINRQVSNDAGSKKLMVCVADDSESGNFSFPALLHRGNVEIAVSTGGCCPSLAVELRDLIATLITEEYGDIVPELTDEREKLLTAGNSSTYNARVIRSLARRLIVEINERKDNA